MQIIMQRVTLGEAWWNAKKMELAEKAKMVKEMKTADIAKKKHKADMKKGKKTSIENVDVSLEFRVRERMGWFKYNFMPWQRVTVLEQLETLDAIEAELEGETDLQKKIDMN